MTDGDLKQLQAYYQERAPEYEKIYSFDEPERRRELEAIETLARQTFNEKSVLEIACGAGYWTELLAGVAHKILASDQSPAMLEIARARDYQLQDKASLTFKQLDAYNLESLAGNFDAALAGFWLSHVPKRRLDGFLAGLELKLNTGAPVLFLDNNLVEGMGGPLIEQEDSSDTFKERTLDNGATHVIIKNYFTKQELQKLLEPFGSEITITMGKWYWSALYLSK